MNDIFNKIFILQREMNKNGIYDKMCEKYMGNTDLFKNHKDDKIILIGGSKSIQTKEYGKYIDEQKHVIRVNTNGVPEDFQRYSGIKTDMIIASEWHLTHDIIRENSLRDKTIYLSMNDIQRMNTVNYCFTTGFICILMLLSHFKQIELFGFGLKNDTNYKDNTIDSFHLKENIQRNICHNINFEHTVIDMFIDNFFKGRLIRGEDII